MLNYIGYVAFDCLYFMFGSFKSTIMPTLCLYGGSRDLLFVNALFVYLLFSRLHSLFIYNLHFVVFRRSSRQASAVSGSLVHKLLLLKLNEGYEIISKIRFCWFVSFLLGWIGQWISCVRKFHDGGSWSIYVLLSCISVNRKLNSDESIFFKKRS